MSIPEEKKLKKEDPKEILNREGYLPVKQVVVRELFKKKGKVEEKEKQRK